MQEFSHSATVLSVSDIERSIDFYTKQLHFTLQFNWQNPPTYAVLTNGGVSIHLSKAETPLLPEKKTALYIFVEDIEAVYEQCKAGAITIITPLASRDYQMADFDILDPDGYLITFGDGAG